MAMEESKELQTAYKIFRSLIYVSVVLEFFMFALDPQILDFWNGIVGDIHGRMKQWLIYNDGNLIYCKIATFLLVCITCIGTRNKKQLEFDARRQVLYPFVFGVGLLILAVIFFNFGAFWLAFVWLMILWILIIFTIWRFFNVNTVAAWLMVPYLLWVTFAAYLNIAVAIMN